MMPSPLPLTEATIDDLLARACHWVAAQERAILLDGRPLQGQQRADATAAGVQAPDRVRLRVVAAMPVPADPVLGMLVRQLGLITDDTIGLTLRYGILRDARWASSRRLLVHELVHTAQYERLGGIAPFLHQYLTECLRIGYPAAPLEQEAIQVAQRICAPRNV